MFFSSRSRSSTRSTNVMKHSSDVNIELRRAKVSFVFIIF